MYKFTKIQSATPQTTSIKTNTWSSKGINLLTASEFQNWNYVLDSENYFTEWDWNKQSRKWLVKYLSNTVWKPVRMFIKLSDNIKVFSAWNEVFYYTESLNTITSIWTYWKVTDDDFVGKRYWDYVYFTNWTWKIQYVTFDYETINDISYNLVPNSGNYVRDKNAHNIQISWDLWNNQYKVTTNESAYVNYFVVVQGSDITNSNTFVWKITNYVDNWWWDIRIIISTIRGTNTLIWTETFDVYQVVYNSSINNNTLSILWTSAEFNSSDDFILEPVFNSNIWDTYKISYNWTWNINSADATIHWFNDYFFNDNMTDTSPVYYTTWNNSTFRIWVNSNGIQTWEYKLSNFNIAVRTEVLISWELSSSPVWAKRLLIFADTDWARLYAWNITWDNTAVKYSTLNQVKDLWKVAFEDWSITQTTWWAYLRTSAWGFTNSNLWELKDFWILNNQIIILFENWKKAFSIWADTVEEAGSVIQVQNLVSRERQDFWWERNPLLTEKGLFYTNESWVWRIVTFWNDAWWTNEENITDILWTKFVESIDWQNCSIVYDNVKSNILITCREKTSTENNLVLVYNLPNKSISKITWWNIERFLKDWEIIYWTSSKETKVYKILEWNTDDWSTITTKFKFEVPLSLDTLYMLETMTIKWDFVWDEFNISFDIYDNRWELVTWYKRIQANLQNVNKFRTLIKRFSRLLITVTCDTTDIHKITYLLAEIKKIKQNRFRKAYTSPDNLWTESWEVLLTENWTNLII